MQPLVFQSKLNKYINLGSEFRKNVESIGKYINELSYFYPDDKNETIKQIIEINDKFLKIVDDLIKTFDSKEKLVIIHNFYEENGEELKKIKSLLTNNFYPLVKNFPKELNEKYDKNSTFRENKKYLFDNFNPDNKEEIDFEKKSMTRIIKPPDDYGIFFNNDDIDNYDKFVAVVNLIIQLKNLINFEENFTKDVIETLKKERDLYEKAINENNVEKTKEEIEKIADILFELGNIEYIEYIEYIEKTIEVEKEFQKKAKKEEKIGGIDMQNTKNTKNTNKIKTIFIKMPENSKSVTINGINQALGFNKNNPFWESTNDFFFGLIVPLTPENTKLSLKYDNNENKEIDLQNNDKENNDKVRLVFLKNDYVGNNGLQIFEPNPKSRTIKKGQYQHHDFMENVIRLDLIQDINFKLHNKDKDKKNECHNNSTYNLESLEEFDLSKIANETNEQDELKEEKSEEEGEENKVNDILSTTIRILKPPESDQSDSDQDEEKAAKQNESNEQPPTTESTEQVSAEQPQQPEQASVASSDSELAESDENKKVEPEPQPESAEPATEQPAAQNESQNKEEEDKKSVLKIESDSIESASEKDDSEKSASKKSDEEDKEVKLEPQSEQASAASSESNQEENAEQERKAKAEQEAKEKAEQEAKEKAEQEAREKAEQEAREKAEQEAREKAEQEAREKAEQEATEQPKENRAIFASNLIKPTKKLTKQPQPTEQPPQNKQTESATELLVEPESNEQSEQTNNKSSKSKWGFMIAGGVLVAAGIAMSFLTFGFGVISLGTTAAALSVAIPSALGAALVTGASTQFDNKSKSKFAIAAIVVGCVFVLSAILLSVFTFGLGVGAVALAGTVAASLSVGISAAIGVGAITVGSIIYDGQKKKYGDFEKLSEPSVNSNDEQNQFPSTTTTTVSRDENSQPTQGTEIPNLTINAEENVKTEQIDS